MNDELKQQHSADAEMQKLIEDAAKVLGLELEWINELPYRKTGYGTLREFNPLAPERGDLMKVAEAAELDVDFEGSDVFAGPHYWSFTKGDYQSLALAILRAASAVLKARGETE